MPVVSEAALAFALSLADGAEAVEDPTPPRAGRTHAVAPELDLMEQRFAELEERLDRAKSPKPVTSAPLPRRTVATEGSAVSEALASVQAQAQAAAELAATLAEAEKSRKSSGGDATVFHVGSPVTQPLQQPDANFHAVLSEGISAGPSPAQLDLHQAERLEALRARETTVTKTDRSAIPPSPAPRTQEELKAIYQRQKGVQQVPRQETQHRPWAPASGYAVLSDFDFADTLNLDEPQRPSTQAVTVVSHSPGSGWGTALRIFRNLNPLVSLFCNSKGVNCCVTPFHFLHQMQEGWSKSPQALFSIFADNANSKVCELYLQTPSVLLPTGNSSACL